MYAVISQGHLNYGSYDDEIKVELIEADKMRNYCVERIVNSLDFCMRNLLNENATEYMLQCAIPPIIREQLTDEYVELYKHCLKELLYIDTDDDPEEIPTYDQYTLDSLMEYLLAIGRIRMEYTRLVVKIIKGDGMMFVEEAE